MSTAKINDTELYYEDFGAGTTLLFLHGWGTSGRVWAAQQVAFAGECRVVTVDLRGCGRSGRTATRNDLAAAVEDVEALIGELRLDRPVLVGSSLGAAIAVETALNSPQLVSGVVSVDGPAYWPARGMDLAAVLDGLRDRRAAFLTDWVQDWFAPGTARPLVDLTIRQCLDASPFADDHFPIFMSYDPRPRLGDLKVPIAYLHGALDPQIPASVSAECAAITPGATVRIIPAAGHMPHQEQPAAFNDALRAALDEIVAAAMERPFDGFATRVGGLASSPFANASPAS